MCLPAYVVQSMTQYVTHQTLQFTQRPGTVCFMFVAVTSGSCTSFPLLFQIVITFSITVISGKLLHKCSPKQDNHVIF